MDYIEIEGYKSIKEAKIEIRPINILIGANGAGKTNFLSFFEFLNNLYERKLEEYISLNGGEDKMLHHSGKTTKQIYSKISFDKNLNGYSFVLERGIEGLVFIKENLLFRDNSQDISVYNSEANVKLSQIQRANDIRNHLNSLKKYHFHDTGKYSSFNKLSHIANDSYFLYEKGDNLAAFLYKIQKEHPIVYNRLIKVIQSVAPYFSDFFFQPNKQDLLRLQWQDKFSSTVYGVTDLSDGTIRFIALVVLFMQPELPETLIIDEPELGLHPFAISKLAGMIQSVASKGTQVIVATQSIDLLSYFNPEDIIAVDLHDGASVFTRLKQEELDIWLNDYALGDLWKRNIITEGQP